MWDLVRYVVVEPDIVKMLREEEKLGKFDMISQQFFREIDISEKVSKQIFLHIPILESGRKENKTINYPLDKTETTTPLSF